jgi:iron complex transport system substrate-binding protein
MKTKNKMLAMLEIVVVLCSVFLVATLPAIATEQNQAMQEVSASEIMGDSEDETLEIYGNANEDGTIDMRDFTYTARIILWLEDETELADANFDGEVNVLDMTQIGLIILGREKELTIVDANGDDVTISMPIQRMVVLNTDFAEAIAVLDERDKVVGVSHTMTGYTRFFPELSTKTDVGGWFTPDIEAILATEPDSVCVYAKWPSTEKLDDFLPDDINIIRLDFYLVETQREEMIKLGYLLNKRERADEYIAWHDRYVDEIYERVAKIPDDEKVRVFIDSGEGKGGETTRRAYSTGTGMHDLCIYAGGVNIAEGVVEGYADVETEWILRENPDVIVGISYKGGYETDDDALMKEHYDEIRGLPGFEGNVSAVINNRVHIMSNAFAFAPHYPVPLAVMAKWLHPDKFADFDPEAMHQEFIDTFLGIDYDVHEQGVFVYPPPE